MHWFELALIIDVSLVLATELWPADRNACEGHLSVFPEGQAVLQYFCVQTLIKT